MAIDKSLAKGLLKRKRREAHTRCEANVTKFMEKKSKRSAWLKDIEKYYDSLYSIDNIILKSLRVVSKKEKILTYIFINLWRTGSTSISISTYICNTRKCEVTGGDLFVRLTGHAMQRYIQSEIPAPHLYLPVTTLNDIVCFNDDLRLGDTWAVYTIDGVFIAVINKHDYATGTELVAFIKTIIPAASLDHLHQERYDQHIKNKDDVWMVQDWQG